MVSKRALKHVLGEIRDASGLSLALFGGKGELLALSEGKGQLFEELEKEGLVSDRLKEYVRSLAEREEKTWQQGGVCFLRTGNERGEDFVLAGTGEGDVLPLLRLSAVALSGLFRHQEKRQDRDSFFRRLILGQLLPGEVLEQARQLRLDERSRRAVFLIKVREDGCDTVLDILYPLYAGPAGGILFQAEPGIFVYVRTLGEKEDTAKLEEIGKNMIDVINTEGMEDAYLSFGIPAEELSLLPRSYEEAWIAMKAGRIFFREKHVISYDRLGIGRLIYSLPMPLCRQFLGEVFAQADPGALDEEALTTIRQFFEDSLNVAETARHLYIHRNTLVYRLDKIQKGLGLNIRNFDDAMMLRLGLMVYEYVREKEQEEEKERKTDGRTDV